MVERGKRELRWTFPSLPSAGYSSEGERGRQGEREGGREE